MMDATCRTILRFEYRPIVAHRGYYRDAADRGWFLAVSISRPRYVYRPLPSRRP
jgi:hypothetical protein